MRVAVVGSGYVGLVSAACLAEIGHDVISVDTDTAKIAALERGEVPIHEDLLPQLLERHRGTRSDVLFFHQLFRAGSGGGVYHGRELPRRKVESPICRTWNRWPPRSLPPSASPS